LDIYHGSADMYRNSLVLVRTSSVSELSQRKDSLSATKKDPDKRICSITS